MHSWRARAEPRSSWLVLFLCVIPVNLLTGMEFGSKGFYYMELVEDFGVSSSTVGLVYTIRSGVTCLICKWRLSQKSTNTLYL